MWRSPRHCLHCDMTFFSFFHLRAATTISGKKLVRKARLSLQCARDSPVDECLEERKKVNNYSADLKYTAGESAFSLVHSGLVASVGSLKL